MKKLLACILLTTLPAMAQPAPIPVFFVFKGSYDGSWLTGQAMHAVLDRPEFIAAAKRDNRILEVAVQGNVSTTGNESVKRFTFTLAFFRGGDKLGEAVEECRSDKLTECADQIALDLTSADQMRR